MSQSELLKRVVSFLETNQINHMITGSYASSIQGQPRSTHDIDVVVSLNYSAATLIPEAFPAPNYYIDRDTILDAIRHQSSFNLLDNRSGDKVDFWILTDDPFDQSRFERKIIEQFEDINLFVSRPEDTILNEA